MIVGPRAGTGLLARAAALTLAAGAAGALPATAAAATPSWAPAWSWESGSGPIPRGCAAYSGRTSAGMRWSPSLVRIVGGRLRLAAVAGTAGGDLAGSGVGCRGRAQRYGRVELRARLPQGAGLVSRIALWPTTTGQGSDWSGLTVPSSDISPAYATNGCGDEAYGAAVPGPLAGSFHDYLVTWSPAGFSVAVDGRTLYRDGMSFDRPRWLGISLSATGPASTGGQLVVERIAADSWTGRMPAEGTASTEGGGSDGSGTDATATSAPAGQDSPDPMNAVQNEVTAPAPRVQGVPASSGNSAGNSAGSTAGSTAAGPGTARPGAAGPTAAALAGDADGDGDLWALGRNGPGGGWLAGGAIAALGVLLGVVRAARAARRRPAGPH